MKKFALVLCAVLLVSVATYARSNMALSRASIKAGYNFEFEAFQVGGDINMGTLTRSVYLVPQLEFIFADGATPVAIDASIQYYLPSRGTIKPYIGGGPGIMFGGGSTDFKLHVIGGLDFNVLHSNNTLFTEFKIRFIEHTDIGIMAGISFKL